MKWLLTDLERPWAGGKLHGSLGTGYLLSVIGDHRDRLVILYRTKDGRTALDVRLEHETLWLTQSERALLFVIERSVITKHISNIFLSGELRQESNVQKMHIAGSDKPVAYYSLDMIISVGYASAAASKTCGSFLAICNRHNAAPLGFRRPISQLAFVTTGTFSNRANTA